MKKKTGAGKQAGAAPETATDDNRASDLPGWILPRMNYPTYRLSLIGKAMNRITVRRLASANDLTYAEWRVMSRIATSEDDATVGQIAQRSWSDRAEISRAAAKLEERGLARRRKDPNDRRTEILTLTRAGHRKYLALLTDRQAFHEALLENLDADERLFLDQILAKIALKLADMSTDDEGGSPDVD